jgi:hypothetical protein
VLSAITTVANERSAAGDAKVLAYAPTLATPAELTACNGHGNPAFHVRVAAELAGVITPKIGW